MRKGSVIIALLVSSGCGAPPPVRVVRDVPAVPDAVVSVAWIEGTRGAWHLWVSDVEHVAPVEVALIDGGRFDAIALSADRRYAIAMTSESTDPQIYERQRIWILDLATRRLTQMNPPIRYVYSIGVDGTSPFLVGSTFREDYGRVRTFFARLQSEPGCDRPSARLYRWTGEGWALEKDVVALDCSSATGAVATLRLELDDAPPDGLLPHATTGASGRWSFARDPVEQRLVVSQGTREVLRRGQVTTAAFWAKTP